MGELKFFAMKALPGGQSCYQVIFLPSQIFYFIIHRYNFIELRVFKSMKNDLKIYEVEKKRAFGGRIAHQQLTSSRKFSIP